MIGMLMMSFIYLVPMAAIAFFVVSLYNFVVARKHYKAEPNEENELKKKTTKTLLVVSSVIMGVLFAVIIAFVSLMFMAVAYM